MSGTGVTGRWETITGSIAREQREGQEILVLTLAGQDIDGLWVGQRTEIPTSRPPAAVARALEFSTRDLATKGVR